MSHHFEKLQCVVMFNDLIRTQHTELEQELLESGTDAVWFARRFRMLEQLSAYQSQLIKKIYDFETDCSQDYADGMAEIISEIRAVTSRNA